MALHLQTCVQSVLSSVTSPNQRHLEPESAAGAAGGAAGHGLASGTCCFGWRGGHFSCFFLFPSSFDFTSFETCKSKRVSVK